MYPPLLLTVVCLQKSVYLQFTLISVQNVVILFVDIGVELS